jgi:ferredoxin-NADP reductase
MRAYLMRPWPLILVLALIAPATEPGQASTGDSSSEAPAEPGQHLETINDDLDQLLQTFETSEPGADEQMTAAMRDQLEQAAAAEDRAEAAQTRAREALRRAIDDFAAATKRLEAAKASATQPTNTPAADGGQPSTGDTRAAVNEPATLSLVRLTWRQIIWLLAAAVGALVLLQTLVATGGALRRSWQHGRQRDRQRQLFQAQLAALKQDQRDAAMQQAQWSGLRRFEVRAKRVEDEDAKIRSFELVPHDGKAIPAYYPGQYLTFQFKVPGQDKPVVRCYSLSDAPRGDHYRISVKRLDPPPDNPDAPPGIASNFLHDRIEEGETVEVRAPGGDFYLDPARDDAPVVLIAGGVGITPLLAMLNGIVEAGGRRETWLFYATRHGGEQIMKSHLQAIAQDYPNINLRLCCSHPRQQDREGTDYHHHGRVDLDLLKRELPSNNYAFYLCGPPAMMDAMTSALAEWGVPDRDVNLEKFGPASSKKKSKPVSADASGPLVTFRRSDVSANWDENAEHLWEFAQANDVSIDSGCLQGRCGTCETAILSGKVKYTNEPSYECEEGTCLTCCAVPDGPVELDA